MIQVPPRFLALVLLCASTVWTGVAAEGTASAASVTAAGRRPRIGLVLAGGGARGLGHVGVIRLLEELRVPVDCIVGTSMGSIVAGLYAAGYTSREMEDWLRECDWDHLLSDSLPRPQRGYRTKTEELNTPRWFEFGVDRSGLKVPNALISGQNLLVALREKTDFVGAGRSFDDLPVRYRAVATDIETGAMVVLDRGALADAMRASMAVPGAFAPYTIDGRVLIDGFASRNLPVSVVREMGVDVIIAVDVRAELLPADKLTSPVSMAQQLVAILSQRDTVEQIATLRPQDVLIRLKMPGYGPSSFHHALTIAQLGYDEAQEARTALSSLSLSPDHYAAQERDRRRLQRDQPVIAAIEVETNGQVPEAAVRNRLNLQPGDRLDPARLQEGLGRVHDLGYFQSVDYRLEDRPGGRVLVVTAKPKPWGPNFAILGVGLGSNLDGSSELNVRTSLRFTQVNRLGAELALKTSVGTIDRLAAEFFQPMGEDGAFFLAPRAEFLRTPEAFSLNLGSVIPGLRPLPLTFGRQTLFGGLTGGVRFGSHGELRLGAERGMVRYSNIKSASIVLIRPDGELTILDPASQLKEYTTNRLSADLTLDRLDDPFFPHRGYYLHSYAERELGRFATTTAGLLATLPVTLRSGLVLQPRLSVDYTLANAADNGRLPFRLGGLFNLSGLPTDEFFGANRLVGALVARKRLGPGTGTSRLYVGGSLEFGQAWEGQDRLVPKDWIFAGSAFLATPTPFGPVHIALGLAEEGDPTLYFYLGRVLP
ncbi:MAG: patatin-like phospholipase family protein [Opitutaceae bacterium]|nr:patatin-like phospholipase family protein [Opitutaceae bacterium]